MEQDHRSVRAFRCNNAAALDQFRIARASGRVQARNCGAPASPSDFAAGLIRLSLAVTVVILTVVTIVMVTVIRRIEKKPMGAVV